MKYKLAAIILLIVCIVLVYAIIVELFKPYHKTKNLEISKFRWFLGIILLLYCALWNGFGSYCYYKGVYHDFLYCLLAPFWSMGLVASLMVALKKIPPTKASNSSIKIIIAILSSLFFIYGSLESCYISIYSLI